MRQWRTLFKKEILENTRNFKIVWVPLVIILLAIMDPITTYYMPIILDTVGGLPDGAIFDIPVPKAPEVIVMSLSQLSGLGVLVLVLISMGTIAGEYKSGITELILVKPVSALNYITSKWFFYILLMFASLTLALITSWYYTNLLFGVLSFTALLQTLLFSSLWFMLVVTITIFYNALVKTPGLVAGLSILSVMALSIVTSAFGRFLAWSPANITGYIHELLITNTLSGDLIATSITTIALIFVLLMSSILIFKTKKLPV